MGGHVIMTTLLFKWGAILIIALIIVYALTTALANREPEFRISPEPDFVTAVIIRSDHIVCSDDHPVYSIPSCDFGVGDYYLVEMQTSRNEIITSLEKENISVGSVITLTTTYEPGK
jgi:hypothetical protein